MKIAGASAANDYLRQDKSKEKRFAFDQAFGSDVDTKTLFKATAEPLIKSAACFQLLFL